MLNNQDKFKLKIFFDKETEITFEDDFELKVAIKVLDAGNIKWEYVQIPELSLL
jgi:hypothetical protein